MKCVRIVRAGLGLAAVAAVSLALAACGETSAPAVEGDSTVAGTVAPSPTAPAPDPAVPNDGGFGAPAAAPGEFGDVSPNPITATATLDGNGCWYLTGAGSQSLLVAPAGTTVAATGTSLVTPTGAVINSGDRVDASGWFRPLDALPGGPDGRWANYVAFCRPAHGDAVVTTGIGAAFDPATANPDDFAAELAERGAALFETSYGCGYGFAVGDRTGAWALHVDVTDHQAAAAGPVSLPDERFVATVTAGAHLFANHCDDVVEWFEPERVVVATWPIIAGDFAVPGGDGAEVSRVACGRTREITLSGAVVDVEGTLVPLADITITNESYGCFAG